MQELARCAATEPFDVACAASRDARALPRDGIRPIEQATGQRLALLLEALPHGDAARFILLN